MGVELNHKKTSKSIFLVSVMIFSILSPTVKFDEENENYDVNISTNWVDVGEHSLQQQTMFNPSLDWWISQEGEVSALVITRDLLSLHYWQTANNLMPEQSESKFGERLVKSDVESLTGVQHRIINLPSWKIPKLAGVNGVMVVMEPPRNPEPATDLSSIEVPEPATWAAVDLHGATKAWDRNISGSGVNVAIVDSGIDFAHPDLNGTQARVDDPNSPWDGWPIMYDGRSLHNWIDNADTYPSDGSSWFSDTSQTDSDLDGDGILDSSGLDVSGLSSQSGVWHIGEHPDNNLQSRVGDDVAILVVDEIVNSSYDTVYVDLDGDGEFGDEVPMRKGSETAGLDLDGDGLWDRSGGMIYFIADGNNSLPYAPTYSARSAMADRIPNNGDLVAFMLNENGGPAGSHGTLCASSVAAQGVVADGKVQGMAPNSKLISVGNYYAGGSSFDAWRFVAEGYDGITDSGDEAQIGSFSFGYSGVVDAGSDQNSMYLDWLTRVYSKNTTYLVALGNGGHGYGTVASPGGAAGIVSVGAFSSRTGESAGATWGESASWSNRGPNSQGRMDPDLVTIGWSATGDVTLNEKTNADDAYRTWGGTSLATPVAAGLMALLYEAWKNEKGNFPDSQTIRDLAMSTASDRLNDPNVQGAGWFDADRATAAILGESESWWMQPASWMPGENSGQHRDANINWMLPGDTANLNLSLHNPTNDSFWVDINATIWTPATHDVLIWNSSDSGDWDGYQSSRPDIVIPLLIHGDSNNTTIANDSTLVRARATIDPRGFDGNSDYQTENRPYLRIYRWNDTDGDGKWWSDDDGDGQVDDGEWESNNEYSTITEHMYASPQVEARIGDPWSQPGDGILLGIFRENTRTSLNDTLPIEIDITSFRKQHDPWVSIAPQALINPSSTSKIPVSITVPSSMTSGLRMSSIEISDSYGHSWNFPIVATIAASGPTVWEPKNIDGNLSNQTLYSETWMQGAQRWGWRAESGDWKAFAIDWPSNLSNGTIIVDVDWPDNGFTDIDAHWLSRIPHPYYQDDPTAYGQWGMSVETGSVGKHRGSGIWERQTSTGGDRELLTAEATPGLKQLILHSTLHGVNTNDNPVNVSVGFAATIAGKLTHSTDDWTSSNISDTLILGSTVDVSPSDISGWGWTQPKFYPGEVAMQDNPGSVSSSSYIREIEFDDVRRIKAEIDTPNGAGDLDLYLYRDKNGNGAIDWGSEKEGSSGNWNSDEEIVLDNPQNGLWWIVVHGYEVPSATTQFWLRISEIGGSELTVDEWHELNESEIQILCPNGCAALGGETPKVAWRVNHTMNLPSSVGTWNGYFELELPSGGGLTIPTYFDMLEEPPVLEFRNQVNGIVSNSTLDLIAHVSDLQTGFNLSNVTINSSIQVYNDSLWESVNLSDLSPNVTGLLLDDTQVNLTQNFTQWIDYHAISNTTNMSNITRPDDFILRSLDVELSIPDNSNRMGWYEVSLSAIDNANLEDEISIVLGYDTDMPLYFTPFSTVFLTNQTVWEHTILGESDLDLTINGIGVPQGNFGTDMWMWPSQTSSTTGFAVWYNGTFILGDEGENLFFVNAEDNAGNHRSSEISVFRDTVPPQLAINYTYDYDIVNVSSLDIDIYTEPGVELWVNGDSIFIPTLVSNITVPVSLEQGVNLINVTVRDSAGNWNNTNLTINVDSIFPVLDWIKPIDSEIVENHLLPLKWNLSEDTIGYISMDGGEWISIPGQSGISYWSVAFETIGEHEFCMSFEDQARNKIVECKSVILNETTYTPISIFEWNNSLTNNSMIYGELWLGPSQSWELFEYVNENWNRVHTGISPNGGNHTIQYELNEGINQFHLVAGGFGVESEWYYTVELDSMPPVFEIERPEALSKVGFASSNEISVEVAGKTEPKLSVECRGLEGEKTIQTTANEEGNFTIEIEYSNTSNLYDGLTNEIVCSTIDYAGNTASKNIQLYFDGTRPAGNAELVLEGQRLWIKWEATSPDFLQNWNLKVLHDDELFLSQSGIFNSSTNTYANQIDLGVVEPGNWSVKLQVWDLANNELVIEQSLVIEEPSTPLGFFSKLDTSKTTIAILVVILLTLLYVLDRKRDVIRQQSNFARHKQQKTVEISPREAVLKAEEEMERDALENDAIIGESGTISDLKSELGEI